MELRIDNTVSEGYYNTTNYGDTQEGIENLLSKFAAEAAAKKNGSVKHSVAKPITKTEDISIQDLKVSDLLINMPFSTGKVNVALANGIKKFGLWDKIVISNNEIIFNNELRVAIEANDDALSENDIVVYAGAEQDTLDYILSRYLLPNSFSRFQKALIVVFYYDQIIASIDNEFLNKTVKGRNRRKEVVAKYNVSEFYIAEGLSLKNNYIEVFNLMISSNVFEYNDSKILIDIFNNRPDLFKALSEARISYNNAINFYHKKYKMFETEPIEARPGVLELIDSIEDLDDDKKTDILQLSHFREDLYQAFVEDKMFLHEAMYKMRTFAPRYVEVVPNVNDNITYPEINYAEIIDEEEEEEKNNIVPPTGTLASKVVENIQNNSNSISSKKYSQLTTEEKEEISHSFESIKISNIRDNFNTTELFIPQSVLDKQNEVLEVLRSNGKLHKYKKVKNNIANIIPEIDTTNFKIANLHDATNLLEQSLWLNKIAIDMITFLQKNYNITSYEDDIAIEALKEQSRILTNSIKEFIFYN